MGAGRPDHPQRLHHGFPGQVVDLGAHTSSVPAAFLCGLETVGELMDDPLMGRYLREIIFDEIIPSIDDPGLSEPMLRVLPSLLGYIKKTGQLPPRLTLSLAALIAVDRGQMTDEPNVIRFFQEVWQDPGTVTAKVLGNTALWGVDLNQVPELAGRVAEALGVILQKRMEAAVDAPANP